MMVEFPHVTVFLWISIVHAAILALLITIPMVLLVVLCLIEPGLPTVKYDSTWTPAELAAFAAFYLLSPALLLYCVLREPRVLRRSPGPLALLFNIWFILVSVAFLGYAYIALRFFR